MTHLPSTVTIIALIMHFGSQQEFKQQGEINVYLVLLFDETLHWWKVIFILVTIHRSCRLTAIVCQNVLMLPILIIYNEFMKVCLSLPPHWKLCMFRHNYSKISHFRAAVFTALLYEYYCHIENEELEPLSIRKTIPLCMDQYKRTFKTSR